MNTPLLSVRGLEKDFRVRVGRRSATVRAIAGVNLDILPGQVYGLVGESGSGKTTLARCVLGLIEPTAGSISFNGADVLTTRGADMRRLRQQIQVVFQDPVGSLDPRNSVSQIVAEPLGQEGKLRGQALQTRVLELLDGVGLAEQHLRRHPHELSGGQCQRVAIARALALRPRMVVLDEPTSSLDVSVQAQILNLLGELRQEHNLTYLLISHDLSVVRYLCDRIGVMYLGRLVEEGDSVPIFTDARHPYTRALLGAAPDVDGGLRVQLIHGDPPSSISPPPGCVFHPRCWLYLKRGGPDICRTDSPSLEQHAGSQRAACHFSDDVPSAIGREVHS